MKKYVSNRVFRIWMYSVSHSTLIIRSEMKIDDYEGKPVSSNSTINSNIDIEFCNVSYLEIPTDFEGISISIKEDNITGFNKYLIHDSSVVFEIVSNNANYFVVAGGCIIGQNKWINQNRILNPTLDYDEVTHFF